MTTTGTGSRAMVVMACDAGYLPAAITLARSIMDAHPGRTFDIGIVSEEALELPVAARDLGLRTWSLGEGNPFRGVGPEGRQGSATYLRLAIPDLLAGDYDRLLYLDCDILCIGPGLDRLLAASMGGHWVAAVRDNTQWRTPGRHRAEFRALGRPARPYFNGGVLMIDVARWRAERVLDRVLELARDHPTALVQHDQSALNLIADGGWGEMSPVWNWQHTWSSRFFLDLAGPRLVHFIGPRKPWMASGADLPPRFRRPFAETLRDFPDRPAPPDPEVPGWPSGLRRSLLKHWAAAPAMERYLRRFPDPFAIVPAA